MIRSLGFSAVFQLLTKRSGASRRRPQVALRNQLEDLESRALLSAVGGHSADIASEIQAIQTPEQGRAAVPRVDGVAGTFDIESNDLGSGTLTIVQDGTQIAGTFNTQNLTAGSFEAQFRTSRARVAKGTSTFAYVGEAGTETFKFTIRFKKNGDFSFRYR